MKKTFPFVLAGCLVAAALAMPHARAAQEEDDADPQLRELEARVHQLEGQLAATSDRLDEVIGYLRKQADGGRAVLGRLDESERLGFTAGINYASREVLLAAWRDYHGGQQKGLPKPARPAEPAGRAPAR